MTLDLALQHMRRKVVRWSVVAGLLSSALPALSFSTGGMSGYTFFFTICSLAAWINVWIQLRLVRVTTRAAAGIAKR
jgi:hypothetical protein